MGAVGSRVPAAHSCQSAVSGPRMLWQGDLSAMNKNMRLLTLAAVGLALFSSMGCDKLRARDQLNKGVEAYKNTHYEEAINHFQQAVKLDPKLLNARLYLATAYVGQYIPGVDSPDNVSVAQQAIAQFQQVIDDHPSREQKVNSAKG